MNPYRLYADNDDTESNYEAEISQTWKDPPRSTNRRTQSSNNIIEPRPDILSTGTPRRSPDEIWLIPANVTPEKIVGKKKENLARIAQSTNTSVAYNQDNSQIEIWGIRRDIDQVLRQLNQIANLYSVEVKSPRSAKWDKPERALTEKEKRKLERRAKRENMHKAYEGSPKEEKTFYGYFLLPNDDISHNAVYTESLLKDLRADTRCFIVFQSNNNLMEISGDSYASVEEATRRIKQIYLKHLAWRRIPKVNRSDGPKELGTCMGWVQHLIEEPTRPYKVKFANLPKGRDIPYLPRSRDSPAPKILEAVFEGGDITVISKDGIAEKSDPRASDIVAMKKINEMNIKKFGETLHKSLGAVHLFQEKIKMRIRFGQLVITDYPKEPLWSIDKFNDRVLRDSRLCSVLSNCITRDRPKLETLFERLSEKDAITGMDNQWDDSPFTEYKIVTHGRNSQSKSGAPVTYAFEVTFKPDAREAKIALWNAMIDDKNVMELNMICPENDYSWKLHLKCSKRLPNSINSSQGSFVYKLHLSPTKHLIYANTNEYVVQSVCEKTKWKFWWEREYVVEVTRYDYWNCEKMRDYAPGIEVVLNTDDKVTTFGVTLYRQQWDDDFAYNWSLETGEAPKWHPDDYINDEKFGGVKELLNDIRKFLTLLESSVSS
ncbi:2789_t:CDS:10 [Paraglomus occultum]|uniref:2789_t:CDS:1 n=1 Tax=Paraglomus occultum TaxID=144539 RepID=A0A9N9AGZ9_9GLOM|nr:2789_t:CDS:10 [Paraglomus occultum]